MEQIRPRPIEDIAEQQRQRDLAELNARQIDTIAQLERDNHELSRQLHVAYRIETALRAEVTELRANDVRWAQRIKALEARLEHIGEIAAGRGIVEGGEEGEG